MKEKRAERAPVKRVGHQREVCVSCEVCRGATNRAVEEPIKQNQGTM